MRKAVRRNLYYSAGVIKLVSDNNAYHASDEEMRAAVDEAHRAGVPVAIHVYGGAAAQVAIDAGVDSIEHGFFLTDAQMGQMKSKGISLVGTDFPRAHLDIIGTSGGIFPPPEGLAPRDRLSFAPRLPPWGSHGLWNRHGVRHARAHPRRSHVRLSGGLAHRGRAAAGNSARDDEQRG